MGFSGMEEELLVGSKRKSISPPEEAHLSGALSESPPRKGPRYDAAVPSDNQPLHTTSLASELANEDVDSMHTGAVNTSTAVEMNLESADNQPLHSTSVASEFAKEGVDSTPVHTVAVKTSTAAEINLESPPASHQEHNARPLLESCNTYPTAVRLGDVDLFGTGFGNGETLSHVSRDSQLQAIHQNAQEGGQEQLDVDAGYGTPGLHAAGGILQSGESLKKIYRLMEIQNDDVDTSFVEKVIPLQDEVLALCSEIVAGSVKASTEGRYVIDFESLNRKSMKVSGFFGSKDMMKGAFQEINIAAYNNVVWKQIQQDSLPAGLYAWLRSESLVVFYWHRNRCLPSASRKDMSCNFIRYIFDLCDTIYVCVEGKLLPDSLFAGAPSSSKAQRMQRLQISMVKASEDSVKVQDGFFLKDLKIENTDVSTNSVSTILTDQRYEMAGGRSRILLLAPFRHQSGSSWVKDRKEYSVSAFRNLILKQWPRDYNMDLKGLSEKDFIAFLRCIGKLQQVDDFKKLAASKEKREADEMDAAKKLVTTEFTASGQRTKLLVDSYLQYEYPWEESLLIPMKSPVHPSTDKPGEKSNSEVVSLHSEFRTSSAMSKDSPLPESSPREIARHRLFQIENDVYRYLVGENSMQRFVFPTSEVRIVFPTESEASRKARESSQTVYKVECPGSRGTNITPIRYGTRVILRPTNIESQTEVLAFKSLQRWGRKEYQGPVLTHEEISCMPLLVGYDGKKLDRFTLEPVLTDGNILDWMRNVAQTMVPSLLKKAALLTFVYQKLDETSLRGCDEVEFIEKFLVSSNPLNVLQPTLPVELHDFAQRKWIELEKQDSLQCGQIAIAGAVIAVCKHIYCKHVADFRSSVLTAIPECGHAIRSSLKMKLLALDGSVRREEREKDEADYLLSLIRICSDRRLVVRL